MRQLVYTMFISNNLHSFTCGERKIWQNIKEPQNIMKMIVGRQSTIFSTSTLCTIITINNFKNMLMHKHARSSDKNVC